MIDFDFTISYPCFMLLKRVDGRVITFNAMDRAAYALFTDADLLDRFRAQHMPDGGGSGLRDARAALRISAARRSPRDLRPGRVPYRGRHART